VEHSIYEMAVAVVARNHRGRITERALIRFKSEEHYEQFKLAVYKKFIGYEIYSVHIRDAQPPEGTGERGQLWCPYCASWNNFFSEDGYTKCEICLVSTRDFWTVRYNRGLVEAPEKKRRPVDPEKSRKRKERRERKKKAIAK
jgi:hypothetical protein